MTSPRTLKLAALVVVLAPVAAVVVFLFGGTALSTCLGGPGSSCWPRALVGPFIRTHDGVVMSLAICGFAWLAASSVLVAHVARVDRRRLVRLTLGICIAAFVMATIGFAHGLTIRLLYAAQGAVVWSIWGLVLGCVVALAWVGLRPGTTRT
jgi:hypothetical protein